MAPPSEPSCVLVTGANGFVGRWLIGALRARLPSRARLIAAVHAVPPSTFAAAGSEAVEMDVTSLEETGAVVAGLAPDRVVHLAAVAAPREAADDPARAWAVNLHGTLNLARAVLRHAPTARFVFAGTSEAYGSTFNASAGALDERAALNPVTLYGATKAAADLAIGQMAREGLQAVRFRSFNHTGPGQSEAFVVPAFAAQIARIETGAQDPVLHVGNLDARRDFLDVRDVVDAYARAVLMAGDIEPGLVLNVASGVPRRIGDVLEALLARASRPIEVMADPSRMRPTDTPLAVGDASRARQLLGWSPRISWDTTLDDVLQDRRQIASRP